MIFLTKSEKLYERQNEEVKNQYLVAEANRL